MTQAPSAVTAPAASTHCQEIGYQYSAHCRSGCDAGGVGLIGV